MHHALRHDAVTMFDEGRPRPNRNERPDAVLVAIPLYRSPELIPDLVRALLDMAPELSSLRASVLFINDSPDDTELSEALDTAVAVLEREVDVSQIGNTRNLGFIASANRAMEIALSSDRDIILLNSDALPRPGAFAEMVSVAYLDPLVSVVSPRSNNATICNSPVAESLRSGGVEDAYRAHLAIERYLPRHTYVPTAVGFCLLVKRLMIAEFGCFDPIYGEGYNEENDFIRRCNQRGYRAVLANHAYVTHLGEASFSKTAVSRTDRQRANHEVLIARYPEYEAAITRYFASAIFRAEHVVSGLVPVAGRWRILFDCRVLGLFFNGTFEHICMLLTAFAKLFANRYDILVLCEAASYQFHGLDRITGLRRCSAEEAMREPAAVAFRLNQPNSDAALSLASYAPLTGALMLDTIGLDCQQLDDCDLQTQWQGVADTFDLIGFNSEFSRSQFERRFELPDRAITFVSLCSTEPADYSRTDGHRVGGRGILLVGNHYPHKYMREMVAALEMTGSELPIISFGLEMDEPSVVESYGAGHISQQKVEQLYLEADVVLFPSHYEGFGLPIMHALARRLPVIARDLPCAREIKMRSSFGHNLHLCVSTDDMAELAAHPPSWNETPYPAALPAMSWENAAQALADAFEAAIKRFDFQACRRHQAAILSLQRQSDPVVARARQKHLEAGIELGRAGIKNLRRRVEDAETRMRAAEAALVAERGRLSNGTREAIDARIRETMANAAAHEARCRAESLEALKVRSDRLFARLATVNGMAERRSSLARFCDEIVLRLTSRHALENTIPERVAHWGVHLTGNPRDMGAVRDRLVRWVSKMSIGEPIRVVLDHSDAQDCDTRETAQALFALAGCVLTRVRFGRTRATLTGTKVTDWITLLAGVDAEESLEFGYRVFLAREPDEAGLVHFRELLAQGVSREEVLLDFIGSDERWSRLAPRCR